MGTQGLLSNWRSVGPELADATVATLSMAGLATLVTVLIGLPLGVLLYSIGSDGLLTMSRIHRLLAGLVDIAGSVPFFVLLLAALPLARALLPGLTEGVGAVVPLTLGAVPFFARRVEVALQKVDRAVIDAAFAMGARARHILVTVLFREGLSRMVTGLALTIVILLGYSAIAGVVYDDGLGRLALDYGFDRYQTDVVLAVVVIFVVLTQGVKLAGNTLARRLEHRR